MVFKFVGMLTFGLHLHSTTGIANLGISDPIIQRLVIRKDLYYW